MSSGTTDGLYGVWGSSPSDIFAVGLEQDLTSSILHCTGANWYPMTTSPVTIGPLTNVWGTSPSNVFAVGNGGRIIYYDGIYWDTTMISGTSLALHGVWGSGSSVFVVGGG